MKNNRKKFALWILWISMLAGWTTISVAFLQAADAQTALLIKDRRAYGKPVRMRMPPQMFIDSIQKELSAASAASGTFWKNFVVEDNPKNDEYVIIGHAYEKNWSFSLLKPDCPKPLNYDELIEQSKQDGTPVQMDIFIGIKKQRSWFRYIVTVYEPMYPYWDGQACYDWSLPSGKAQDKFYNKNYRASVYAKNLAKLVHDEVKNMQSWKLPKKPKAIPVLHGAGSEMVGENLGLLTDQEQKLPAEEQRKLIEQRKKD